MAQEFVINNGFISRDDSQLSGSLSVLDSNVSMTGFVSGFSGYGTKVDFQNNTVDTTDMSIRGRLSVYELLINQIRATNGAVWVSSTGKVETIGGVNSSFTSTQDEVGGLKRYFTFDDISSIGGVRRDYSGEGADITTTTGTTTGSVGKNGYGIYVQTTTSDTVRIPNLTPQIELDTPFTLAGWFNVPSYPVGGNSGILSAGGGANSYGILVSNTGTVSGIIRSNSNSTILTLTSSLATNTWFHAMISFDPTLPSGNVKVFYNGELKATGDTPAGTGMNDGDTNYLSIFARRTPSGTTCTNVSGSADNIRVYNRAISTAEEATFIMNSDSSQTQYPSNGLVALYNFNDGSTSIARDYTGNGYTGSLNNGVTIGTGVIGNTINTSGSFSRDMTTNIPSATFTSPFSVATWVYSYGYLSNGSVVNMLFGYGGDVAQTGRYAVWVDSSNNVNTWIDTVSYGTSTNLTIGEWKHVVSTIDHTTGQIKTYIDAVLVGNSTIAPFTFSGSLSFNIANQGNNDVRHLNAQYESVHVYNRILSQDEVSALYNNRGGIALNTGEDTNHGFAVGDLIRAQRFSGHGVYQSDGVVSYVQNLQTFRFEPINLANPTLELPREGYEYVRIGNIYDTTRQGAVYMTADDSGAPYMDVIDGIDSFVKFNTAGTIKTRTGNLSGITSPVFGALTNQYGFYASGSAYLEGSINATAGKIANLTITGDKVYEGTGTYGNVNTKLFLSSSGDFSLGDKFTWNGTTLNIDGTLVASTGSIAGWNISNSAIYHVEGVNRLIGMVTSDSININGVSSGGTQTMGRGFGVFLYNTVSQIGDIKVTHLGRLHALNETTTFTDEYGFEIIKRTDTNVYKHIMRIGSSSAVMFGSYFDESNLWMGNTSLSSTSTNVVISSANGGKIAMAPTGTAPNTITLSSNTGVLLSASGEFNFSRNANNYIRGIGSTIDIKSTVFNLSASSTLILESTTPKFALGASANTQTLSVGTGVFLNGSGHFKAGNASGQRLIFDGTNILLSASNAVITGSSGWLGGSSLIQWSGTEVRIAGTYLDASRIWTGDVSVDSATLVLDSTLQRLALGTDAYEIGINENSGILLSGSGEFNLAYDANNYIRRSGTTFDLRATNAIISGSSVNIGAEAFNLKAGNLFLVGNGASSYIRLGSLTSTDPNTTNTGSYFDNTGTFLFKAGTSANTNYIRFNANAMTIHSTAFDLVVGNTLGVSSATGGLITLGGSDVTYANSNVAFSGSGIGKFGSINIDGISSGSITTSNYNPGVTGWKIDGTGTAEFNDVTVRGAVRGAGSVTDAFGNTFNQSTYFTKQGIYFINSATEIDAGSLIPGDSIGTVADIRGFTQYRYNDLESKLYAQALRFVSNGNYFPSSYVIESTDGATVFTLAEFRGPGNDDPLTTGYGFVKFFRDLIAGVNLKVLGTTDSTSKDTGSIITEGGVGVEKNLHIGGELHAPNVGIKDIDASPYPVTATDTHVAVDTSISTVVNLPAGTLGRKVTIFDSTGGAFIDPITINRNGSDTINGATSTSLTTNYQSVTLLYHNGNWVII